MEKAIDVMRLSISEPRDDKVSPKVGAVLWLKGEVQTASRGELRYGDHAEFTLLERKNRERALDGGILFATLEPCAPGARNHPKLSCAERIVNARIKKVYIGIEDDDPTVARKGIQYLENHGVEWELFDRDLQEVILKENEDFFKWARAQAGKETEEEKPVQLSPLESRAEHYSIDDFSVEALEYYREKAAIPEARNDERFLRRLLQQNLLEKQGKNYEPTQLGILTFAEEPRRSISQAGLLATVRGCPTGR
ncbi:hypothetical protein [Roseibacillus ishigakijimensis]